jgi:hypothetical protein
MVSGVQTAVDENNFDYVHHQHSEVHFTGCQVFCVIKSKKIVGFIKIIVFVTREKLKDCLGFFLLF